MKDTSKDESKVCGINLVDGINDNFNGEEEDTSLPIDANDIVITITYKNEKLVPVCQKQYSLGEYTSLIKNDIMRIITDVEDTIYEITGLKKSEWTNGTLLKFEKIKHKLLDKAGEVGRIPSNMSFYPEVPVYMDSLSAAVKEILDAIGAKQT